MSSVAARIFLGLRVKSNRGRARAVLLALCCLLAVVAFFAVDKGAVEISLLQCVAIIGRRVGLHLPWQFTAQQEATLLYIRLPRVALGLIVGAGLGVSGAAMQGLFRNPLADPSLIGISSGAALAATMVVIIGDAVSFSAP
ncbi:MAG TPA: iron chelate uptake ABC transporter family permease subunit, partial [Pyrinomonadaceae bacterium]